jgi:hypothetical protein
MGTRRSGPILNVGFGNEQRPSSAILFVQARQERAAKAPARRNSHRFGQRDPGPLIICRFGRSTRGTALGITIARLREARDAIVY